MMANLWSDQPSKIISKSILVIYEGNLLRNSVKVKGHNAMMRHRAIAGEEQQMKEAA